VIDGAYHFHGAFLVLFLLGLYTMIDDPDLFKKVIGLNVMQISVFLLLVTIAYPAGAAPPLLDLEGPHPNPLAHVLVLTAIVVGVALTALALALIVRLHAEFGTVDAREIEAALAADDGSSADEGEDARTDGGSIVAVDGAGRFGIGSGDGGGSATERTEPNDRTTGDGTDR
jgi:multicomponent Na+:H+ antiporter subunit C